MSNATNLEVTPKTARDEAYSVGHYKPVKAALQANSEVAKTGKITMTATTPVSAIPIVPRNLNLELYDFRKAPSAGC